MILTRDLWYFLCSSHLQLKGLDCTLSPRIQSCTTSLSPVQHLARFTLTSSQCFLPLFFLKSLSNSRCYNVLRFRLSPSLLISLKSPLNPHYPPSQVMYSKEGGKDTGATLCWSHTRWHSIHAWTTLGYMIDLMIWKPGFIVYLLRMPDTPMIHPRMCIKFHACMHVVFHWTWLRHAGTAFDHCLSRLVEHTPSRTLASSYGIPRIYLQDRSLSFLLFVLITTPRIKALSPRGIENHYSLHTKDSSYAGNRKRQD